MSSRHYDVAVLGGTVAAAVTAALLARRNVRGVLIDQGELADEPLGLAIDHVPLGTPTTVEALVHAELGLTHEIRRATRPAPALQWIGPERREPVVLSPATLPAAFVEAIEREDARLSAAIDALPSHPPRGFFARRRVRALAGPFTSVVAPDAGELADALEDAREVLLGAATHQLRPGPAATVRALARLLRGAAEPEDGRGLRRRLLEVAERAGFEVERASVERIEPSAHGFLLAGGARERSAARIVDATAELSGLRTLARRPRALDELLERARPAGWLSRVGVELDDAVLPTPLAADGILAERPGAPPLGFRRVGEPPRRRLFVFHPTGPDPAEAARLYEAVLTPRLERVLPFFAEGHPVPVEGGARTHPYFSPALDPALGIGGIPTETPVRGIHVAGPAVLPGLGVEGQYIAALEVADAIDRAHRHPRTRRERARPSPAAARGDRPPP